MDNISNVGVIDTDGALATILSNFSTDYIMNTVQDSLNMRYRVFEDAMPNLVDILERQFTGIVNNAPDYVETVVETKLETYREIIKCICNYYNLEFADVFDQITSTELYGIARTLYDVFVSRFTDYMVNFFISYIVNNAPSIAAYLSANENSRKPKDAFGDYRKTYLDHNFVLIHANINEVIYNMAAYDIPLSVLLHYFCDKSTADRLLQLIADKGDIFKNYYASFILNSNTSATLMTSIKLGLQGRTQEVNLL